MNQPIKTALYADYPTKHRVIRNGRRTVVWERVYDACMGGGSRYVTRRSARDMKRLRDKHYRGCASVNVQTWGPVHDHEIQ